MAKRMIAAGNGSQRFPLIDDATNTQMRINYDHYKIHGGKSFHITDVLAIDTSTAKWMITTPNSTSYAHMIFNTTTTGESLIVITEGADRTGTTALPAINRDRNSATTSDLVIHRAYTAGSTDGATTIYTKRTGATGIPAVGQTPGSARGTLEFILKADTKYIISITTYAAVVTTLDLNWYEHTNRTF